MDDSQKLQAIRRKTRQRLLFALLTLLLYFAYVVNYTAVGAGLARTIGDSRISASLLMFIALVLLFIALELVFLALNRDPAEDEQ